MEQSALKVAEEVCREIGAELKVYHVSSFKGRMWARLKGIKNTSTIVAGKNKIEGMPNKEQLLALVK